MFIKTIVKTDKKSGKRYDYYRLWKATPKIVALKIRK